MLKMKMEPRHIVVLVDAPEALVKVLVQSRYQLFDFFFESTLSNLTNPLEM